METDINVFAGEILENTGVDFCVFDDQGAYVYGNATRGETVPPEFSGVFSDVGLNKTFFRFRFIDYYCF